MASGVCRTVVLWSAVLAKAVASAAANETTQQLGDGLRQNRAARVSEGKNVSHDCKSLDKEVWSEDASAWCCEHEHTGCRFNCMADYDSWQTVWTDLKKMWCCEREQLGCGELRPAGQRYDCQGTVWDINEWSPQQRAWCCSHRQLGCPPTTTRTLTTSTLTTTSTRTPSPTRTTKTPAAAVDKDQQGVTTCFEDKTSWEPLDMPGTAAVVAAEATECQKICANTTGCVHFSYWWLGKSCHLQDAYAIRQPARLGFVSGPQGCWESLNKTEYVRKGDFTFLPAAFKCVELGVLYTPLMGLARQLPSSGADENTAETIKRCSAYCAETEGCAHFTLVFPQRLCRLAGRHAQKMESYQGAVSGSPTTCWDERGEPTDTGAELQVIMKTSSLRGGRRAATSWKTLAGHLGKAVLICMVLLGMACMSMVRRRGAVGLYSSLALEGREGN